MFGALLEDLANCTPAERDIALRRIEVAGREIEALKLAVIAIGDAAGDHRGDGHRSTLAYLRGTTNQSRGRLLLRRAKLVGAHPQVGDALLTGRIGVSQVDQIARMHANPRVGEHFTDEAVDYFAERAEHRPLREPPSPAGSSASSSTPARP